MSHSYLRRIKTRHTGLVTHSVMGNLDCLKCVSFSTKGLKYLKLFIDSVSKKTMKCIGLFEKLVYILTCPRLVAQTLHN